MFSYELFSVVQGSSIGLPSVFVYLAYSISICPQFLADVELRVDAQKFQGGRLEETELLVDGESVKSSYPFSSLLLTCFHWHFIRHPHYI